MRKKRLLAGLLSIAMILTQVPMSTYAELSPVTQTETVAEQADKSEDNNTSKSAGIEAATPTDTENNESSVSTQSGSEEKEAVSWKFMNDGYPYGKDMTSSQVTLVMDVDGTASSYQWQSAKDGEYTDIDGATEATYKIESENLTYGTWYRCVVDDIESKAVETVKPNRQGDNEDRIWAYGNYSNNSWFISNGKMAYMVNGTQFDVTGLYSKNNNDYMLCTSYNAVWDLYSDTSGTPAAQTSRYGNGNAELDALRVAFNDKDDYDVIIEADLAEGQQAFSFGCDTQLGNSSTSGDYSDTAPLKAVFKNKKFFQVSMIGAKSFNEAKDEDPAFVIAPITDNSIFWLGKYNERETYSYNTRPASDNNYTVKNIDGQNVVTLLEGIDSGMTMSWLNLESGSSVKFRFCVGDVKDTGAVNGKVDYSKEKIIGLDKSTDYIVTIEGEEGTQYTVTSDENGELSLVGTDKDGKAYDFIGKNINIVKYGNPDAAMDLEIAGRPDTPQNPSDLEGGSDSNNPELDQNIEIKEMTADSVTIAPKNGQQYAYSTDGTNWTILDDNDKEQISYNTYYKVKNLSGTGKVYIKTRVSSTNNNPASKWSDVTELTLKETIKADVSNYNATYDGLEHSITVTPTNVEDADIKYSLTKDGEYTLDKPMQKDATTSRNSSMNNTVEVYYRIEKEGYYPLYGSASITIWQKPLTITWSEDTTFIYDGTAKLPKATVDGVLKGDEGNLIVYSDYDSVNVGTYKAKAKYSNTNYSIEENYIQFTIEKADREAPSLKGISESIIGKNDGRIEGLTTEMEYRKVTSDVSENPEESTYEYKDVDNENMTFESGTYAVRYKESRNYKVSSETEVTIDKGRDYIIVSLPSEEDQIGYTITNTGNKTQAGLNEEATFTFKFELKPGYNKTSDFKITVNDNVVEMKEDGTFSFTKGKDYNEDLVIKVTGVADITPPTGEITLGTINPWKTFINDITFNHFFKERQQVVITAADNVSGVKNIEYYVFKSTEDKKELSFEDVEYLGNDDWTVINDARAEFYINPDIRCVIYARITDNAGNITYISSEGIVLDNTAPVITGITEDGSYCQNIDITVKDDNIESVVYKVDDGDAKTLTVSSDGKYTLPVKDIVDLNETKNIEVTATDKSGNITSINIKAVHQYKFKENIAPTVLFKGYSLSECISCKHVYEVDYNVDALGESGLTPSNKENLIKFRDDAQNIIDNYVKFDGVENKEFYENLIVKINSMLGDIQTAENLIKEIDDINISAPTIKDVDSLKDAISKIDALLDAENKDTPTQSLTDEQKNNLLSIKEDINQKLIIIEKANNVLNDVAAEVDTIKKIENIQPADQTRIEAVLDKLIEIGTNYYNYYTDDQKKDIDETYYNQMLDKLEDASCKDIDSMLDNILRQIDASISGTTEKENAVSNAKAAAEKAKTEISYASTKGDMVEQRNAGKDALDNITGSIDAYKDAIKNNIDRVFKEKQNEIENMTDLTDEQKKAALSKLEADKNSAYEAIEGKESKNEVVDVFDDVNSKFDTVIGDAKDKDLSNAKNKAKEEIATRAGNVKKAIESMPHLTDEEKKAAKNQADEAAKIATEDIDKIEKADDKSQVASKKAEGIQKLDKIEETAAKNNLDNLKAAVKTDIDSRAKEAKEYINSLADLTEEEKTSYKEAVEAKADETKSAVDAITDISKLEDVKAQKEKAETDIKKIEDEAASKDLSNAKDKAKNEIATRAEDTKKAIEAMPHLADEEKEAAKKQAEEAAKTVTEAIDNIETAADKSQVASKKSDGIKELDKIEETAAKNNLDNLKAAVKTDIDSRAKEAKEYIDGLTDLTEEEKTSYKETVKAKADETKSAVDAITDISKLDDVMAQKEKAETDIKKIEDEAAAKDLSNVKAKVWDELEKQYKDDVAYIESLTDLTAEEIEDYSFKIKGNALVAYIGIEKVAASKSEIEEYKSEYNKEAEKLKEEAANKDLSSAKKKAKDKIAERVEDTKKAIEAMPHLTDEEKTAAKNQAEEAAKAATEAIEKVEKATDKSQVASKKSDGIKELDKIEESAANNNIDNLKAAVKTDIDSRAEEGREYIDSLTDLTAEEKTSYKAAVEAKAEEAKKSIDAITDASKLEDVKAQKETAETEIKKIEDEAAAKDLSNAKDKAKEEIATRVEAVKKAIESMPHLTDEEKTAAKNQAEETAKTATESVDNIKEAAHKSQVGSKKAEGIEELDKIEETAVNNNLDNLKAAVKTDIDSRAEEASEYIDGLTDLTEEEKTSYKEAVKAKVDETKSAVDAITDVSKLEDVKAQKEIAETEIKKIEDEAAAKDLSNAKDKAKNEIATRAEAVKKAIESMPHLTDEEKTAAKNQAEEAAKTATEAIDKIETAADKSQVASKKSDGIKELDKIEETAANNNLDNLKAAVKTDIDSRAEEAREYIDGLTDLTEEEKTSYKETVEIRAEEAKKSIDAITDVSKLEDVKAQKETAETDIKKIEDEAAAKDLSNLKAKVWDELEKQYKDDVAYIESLTDLTAEEITDYSDKIIGNALLAYIGIEKVAASKPETEEYKSEYNNEAEKLKEEASKKDLSGAKKKAQDEIAKKVEDIKKAIDAMPDISEEKKSDAKKNIDDVSGKAIEEISAITEVSKKSEITSKRTDTFKNIEAIEEKAAGEDLDNLKEAAKTDVNNEAKQIKEAIDNLADITEAEKAAIKEAVEKKAEETRKAIDDVTNPANKEDVHQLKKKALEEFAKELETAKDKDLSNVKDKAKAELNDRAEDTKKAVDAMPNLTIEQKEAAKNQIDEMLKETEKSINSITDASKKSEVNVAKEECVRKFDLIEEDSANSDFDNLKEAAKIDIESRAEEAKKSIDNMADLTTEEKEAAKAEIDKKADAAKKSVDAVTDSSKKDDIKSEKESVTADIKKQHDDATVKNESNAKENVIKAEETSKKTEEVIADIKVNATDEESIKSQIKEELKKSNLENVDVDINEFKKVPATLHESGKITGKAEIKAGSTTKVVEINQELPALSTFVNYESVVEKEAPKADILVDEKSLMDNVLSEKEIEALSNGSNADLILSVQNKQANVTDDEEKAIAGKLSDNAKVGKYLDISLYMNIIAGDGTPIVYNEKIHEAKTMFTIKMNVPEDLWKTGDINRTYQIIRVHDGAAEILDCVYDETEHTLTFKTDRFSTYAIAYKDVEKKADTDISDNNAYNSNNDISKDNVTDSFETEANTSTATGDMNHAALWMLLMALASVAIFTVSKKKKYVK